ncbi:MAG: pyridoxal-dependent decarboxylase [bacterium]|nr:pyridoxal-dependent decarboxylase [bacterium]
MTTFATPGAGQQSTLTPRLIELAHALFEAEQTAPVSRFRTPEEMCRAIELAIPEKGSSPERVMDLLEDVALATPRTASRRFFNQLFAGRHDIASAAEIVAVLLNSSMYTYKAAGPHVLIEKELGEHMGRKVGYDDGEGIFTPGGSLSNFAGIMIARNEFNERCQQDGHDGSWLTLYSSELDHYSIAKNLAMLGLGRRSLRKVATDERGRMRADALRDAIKRDIEEGAKPFCINATCGTTVLGAYDPLDEIADVAEEFGVWFHVDGAFGGSTALSAKHRDHLKGSERSDSFTWDAHKMMGVPLSCSVILTKDKGLLRKHFSESASYLFQSDEDELNHGVKSMQCGRRNDCLKLWAAWQHLGDEGYARKIDRLYDLARSFAERVKKDPRCTLSKEPESVNVCFEVTGKPSDLICETLRQQQKSLVGFGIVDGRRVIRAAFVNADVDEADLDDFFDNLVEVAMTLPDGDNAL